MSAPAFKVAVKGGADITSLIKDRLVSLEITDKAGTESDSLYIVLDDREKKIELPRRGVALAVSLGHLGGPLTPMGTYTVDTVTVAGPVRTMVIRANAANFTGPLKAPKEMSWHDTTLGDIASKIASEHGLKTAVDPKFGSIKINHEDQTESDLAFLARLCNGIGCVFKVGDENIVIAEKYAGKSQSGQNLPTATLFENNCSNWTATIAERGKYGSAKARWYDPSEGKTQVVSVGSGKPEIMLSRTYGSKDEAERAASSALSANSSGTGKLSIKGAKGDPTISAEAKLVAIGFRPEIDAMGWNIEQVRHRVDASGYTCDIEAEVKDPDKKK